MHPIHSSQKILITGVTGMLGKDIANCFIHDENFQVYGISRKENPAREITHYNIDLTDLNALKQILDQINPDIIIHCAANVNVDNCEENKDYCYKLNTQAAGYLAAYRPHSTKYVYISTDSIFDGKKGNYKEQDRPNPQNYYASTKLQGETLSLKQNPNAIIIRTNIYGFHIPAGNSLVEWLIKSLTSNNSISGFSDVYFNPVYTVQLAEIIKYIITHADFKGILNVGCEEQISKYHFLIKLSKLFNLDYKSINSCSIDDLKFKARRPKNTTLDISKLKSLIKTNISLEDGLHKLKQDYYKNIKGEK